MMKFIYALLALTLLTASLLIPPAPAVASGRSAPIRQGYTYEECGAVDAEALRLEIESLALSVFTQGTADIDIPAIVTRSWADLNMDAVVDEAVAAAVLAARQNSDYWSRFLSGWSVARANAFATAIAEEAFAAPAFVTGLETLATATATELTAELTAMTAQAGSTALLCLQEYVGDQYSTTLYALFEREVAAGLDEIDLTAADAVDVSALELHTKGLTGLSVIIATQMARRIATRMSREMGERVAGRIAGRVLGRVGSSLIPLAGWVIGGALIVWDLVDGSNGALPQIEKSLTSPEIKAAIAAELAAGVEEELQRELELTAATMAADMVDEWRLFCTRHPYLCTLPAENPSFRVILDTTPVQDLTGLSALVTAYMETLGREALEEAVATGAFERMLPEPAFAAEIIRTTGATDAVEPWLARLTESEITESEIDVAALMASGAVRYFNADDLSDGELTALLALDDPMAVAGLAPLSTAVRAALLDAHPADVAALATTAAPDDLTWLVAYSRQSATSLPRLVRDLTGGATTFADLRAAAAVAEAASGVATANSAVATPDAALAVATSLDNGGRAAENAAMWPSALRNFAAAQRAGEGPPVSPILLIAGLLLALLTLGGFVIFVFSSVKRNKQI